jgi:hypothetical protein
MSQFFKSQIHVCGFGERAYRHKDKNNNKRDTCLVTDLSRDKNREMKKNSAAVAKTPVLLEL